MDQQANVPFYVRYQKVIIGLVVFLIVVILPLKIMGEILTSLTESSPGRIIEGSGEDIIAVLNLDGVLVESPPGGGLDSLTGEYTSVRRLRSVLNEIKQEERLAGLIIRINSPGGSAAASEEMYQLLLSFKNDTEVPILAYFSDTAASGAYYLSMGADEIMANPNAITGSIGVIVSALNYRQLAENWGIEQVVFKSGEYKDLLNPFEETDPVERRIIEGLVSDIYENFVATVATGRGMENEVVRELGDGRIYSAREAKDKGLIDEMGPLVPELIWLKKEVVKRR